MKVVFSGQAQAGLRDIALYIARHNPVRARSFVREIQARARAIGEMPRAHPLVPRYADRGIRRCPYRDYLIFYRVDDDVVSVVHIQHAARDYEAILFPDS
jgi:addiction module RelE/StbE family toxin